MIRTFAALALALALSTTAWAQLIVRPPPDPPQPVGVIQPPSLPFPGSNTAPSPTPPARVAPSPYLIANPFYYQWGFSPLWPIFYDYDTRVPSPSYVTVPVRTEVTVVTAPPPAPAPLRARLTLNIPESAQVWLSGKPVDVTAVPMVIESPPLEPGQRYAFDLRVAWKEQSGAQERKRTVIVDAGQNTSLTYTAATPAGTAVRLSPR
jgi:uncharacterized protein (TIGR03000 family)